MDDRNEEVEMLNKSYNRPKLPQTTVDRKRYPSWMKVNNGKNNSCSRNKAQIIHRSMRKPMATETQYNEEKAVENSADRIQFANDITRQTASSQKSSTCQPTSLQILDEQVMHQQIREKLKKQLEAKREKVRSNKQLMRQQQNSLLKEGSMKEFDEIDQTKLDQEIEYALKLGIQRTNNSEKFYLPDDLQYEFMTGIFLNCQQLSNNTEQVQCKVIYMAAKPTPPEEAEQFAAKCRIYDGRSSEIISSIEDGIQNATTTELKHQALLIQRVGSHFVNDRGKILGTDLQLNRNPKRPERNDEDLQRPYCYVKAENWKKALIRNKQEDFVQLDIDLNGIAFSYHWLFGEEDLLCSTIENLHKAQSLRTQEALNILTEIETKQREMREGTTMKVKDKENTELRIAELMMNLQEKQQNYLHISDQIEENWIKLQQLRQEQGYSTTTLIVTKTSFEQQQHEMREENKDDTMVAAISDKPEVFEALRFIPVYVLSSCGDNKISKSSSQMPKEERARINFLQSCRLQLQIEFNDIVVCRTLYKPLDCRFQSHFGQIYNLQIQEIPESITVTIFEKVPKIEARKIAVVGLPLPDEDNITDGQSTVTGVQFASDLAIKGIYSSLGCGDDKPWITGELYCNVSWARQGLFKSKTKRPQRSVFTFQQKEIHEPTNFNVLPQELCLYSDDEFDNDMRLQALINRYEQKSGVKMRIPLLNSEFEENLIMLNHLSNQQNFKTEIDKQRILDSKYATMIRNRVREQMMRKERMQTIQNLVNEEPLPTFFGIFGSLFASSERVSRKLKPSRRIASNRQVLNEVEYCLAVNIQSAINLPEPEQGTLQPFVEVSFQDSFAQTSVTTGKNANWQQTVELKLDRLRKSNNNFNTVTDFVQIAVYDRLVSKLDADDREPNSVHEQLERRWLGSIRLPFATIYCNGKIDGRLRLQTPLFLTSYKISKQPAYLKLLIAFEPAICPPQISFIPYSSIDEPHDIYKRSHDWERSARSRFPDRRYFSTVQSTTGKRILICRFIRPIKPPFNMITDTSQSPHQTACKACRIISYIPFVAEPVGLPNLCDVWTTADQFLRICCGDMEEHAILLCCWLLYFGIQSYVLFGTSLPEGLQSAYILALIPQGALILNPSDGNSYSPNDPLCPLNSIGTVATVETQSLAAVFRNESSRHAIGATRTNCIFCNRE